MTDRKYMLMNSQMDIINVSLIISCIQIATIRPISLLFTVIDFLCTSTVDVYIKRLQSTTKYVLS